MSRDKDNGGSAFPGAVNHAAPPGMTLRDWFAGQAGAACIGGLAAAKINTSTEDAIAIANASYIFADAMIAERSK